MFFQFIYVTKKSKKSFGPGRRSSAVGASILQFQTLFSLDYFLRKFKLYLMGENHLENRPKIWFTYTLMFLDKCSSYSCLVKEPSPNRVYY